MSNSNDKDKIKKELEELKKRNQELEKMIKTVFNKIDKINGLKKENEKVENVTPDKMKKRAVEKLLERDLQSLKEKKITQNHRTHLSPDPKIERRRVRRDERIHPLREGPLPPSAPNPPDAPLPPERIGGPSRKHILLSKEEIARAREEINRAREELRREREKLRHEARRKALESAKKSDAKPFIFSKNIDLDGFGETISKYVESILSSVSRNIEETVKSAFSPDKASTIKFSGSSSFTSNEKGRKFSFPYDYRRIPIEEIESYLEEISELLSAIGDKNRLHILKLLELQPEYQKELSEKTGLRGGTFKHHTDILAKNGLITQETVRGRYLITQLGIEALKLAEILYTRKQELYSSEDSLDDEEDDDEINIDIS